jgi:hypothetical protein
VKTGKAIKPKGACCKSGPRCSRCPVVLRRLEAQGLAERKKKRYLVSAKLKKKQLRAARAR